MIPMATGHIKMTVPNKIVTKEGKTADNDMGCPFTRVIGSSDAKKRERESRSHDIVTKGSFLGNEMWVKVLAKQWCKCLVGLWVRDTSWGILVQDGPLQ